MKIVSGATRKTLCLNSGGWEAESEPHNASESNISETFHYQNMMNWLMVTIKVLLEKHSLVN